MTQSSRAAAPVGASKVRKVAMQMVVGAAVGASVTFGLLTFVGKSRFDLDDPSRVIALATGLVFALTGLVLGLGVLAPRSGAHLLNVEDAEELREQRGPLWRAALVMVLLGATVLALALGRIDGSAGLFSSATAVVVAATCFTGVVIVSIAGRNDHDELMHSVSRESMTVAMYVLTALIGVWAAAAHLGYADWITPLDMISALLIVQLGSIIIVSAKRGLLRPR